MGAPGISGSATRMFRFSTLAARSLGPRNTCSMAPGTRGWTGAACSTSPRWMTSRNSKSRPMHLPRNTVGAAATLLTSSPSQGRISSTATLGSFTGTAPMTLDTISIMAASRPSIETSSGPQSAAPSSKTSCTFSPTTKVCGRRRLPLFWPPCPQTTKERGSLRLCWVPKPVRIILDGRSTAAKFTTHSALVKSPAVPPTS